MWVSGFKWCSGKVFVREFRGGVFYGGWFFFVFSIFVSYGGIVERSFAKVEFRDCSRVFYYLGGF